MEFPSLLGWPISVLRIAPGQVWYMYLIVSIPECCLPLCFVGWYFSLVFKLQWSIMSANSGNPVQTLRSVASALGMPMPTKKDATRKMHFGQFNQKVSEYDRKCHYQRPARRTVRKSHSATTQ